MYGTTLIFGQGICAESYDSAICGFWVGVITLNLVVNSGDMSAGYMNFQVPNDSNYSNAHTSFQFVPEEECLSVVAQGEEPGSGDQEYLMELVPATPIHPENGLHYYCRYTAWTAYSSHEASIRWTIPDR